MRKRIVISHALSYATRVISIKAFARGHDGTLDYGNLPTFPIRNQSLLSLILRRVLSGSTSVIAEPIVRVVRDFNISVQHS